MGLVGEGVDILKLVDKGAHADLYKQLGEWIDKVLALQRDNEELRTKCAQIAEQLRYKGSFERVGRFTYVSEHDCEICPRCADSRPVRLIDADMDGRGRKATCPQCRVPVHLGPPILKSSAMQRMAGTAPGSI